MRTGGGCGQAPLGLHSLSSVSPHGPGQDRVLGLPRGSIPLLRGRMFLLQFPGLTGKGPGDLWREIKAVMWSSTMNSEEVKFLVRERQNAQGTKSPEII